MSDERQVSILLVDPDESARDAIAAGLRNAGFVVDPHPDYRGALETLEGDAPLDCMITALMLPKGTPHGVALGHMASVKRPGLPLFFIASNPEEAEWVDDRWSRKVFMRPVDVQLLAEEIARMRGESDASASD